jgi:hypothetical protein
MQGADFYAPAVFRTQEFFATPKKFLQPTQWAPPAPFIKGSFL